jgi:hypothetical protein
VIYQLKPYWDALLAERASSCALIAILYLLAGLFVRSWFLGPLFSSLKQLEKSAAKEIGKLYLGKSLLGWIFFLLPLVLLLILLNKEAVPVPIDDNLLAGGAVLSFAFSIVLHLIAFGLASVAALKKTSEAQEKKLFEA